MKKILFQFAAVLIATTIVLSTNAALAAKAKTGNAMLAQTPPPIAEFEETIGSSGLSDFENRLHSLANVEPGADTITTVLFLVIDFIKYLLGAIAILYITITGIKLISAGGKVDEVSEKAKESIKLIIYGLILAIIADELVTRVFFGDYGECLKSATNAKECAQAGGGLIKGIYSFIMAVIASVAIFMLVLSGFKMITAYGNEEEIGKQKKHIAMAIVGLIIVGVAEFVVKGIVFPEGGTKGIDVAAAQKLVFTFTNFISAFIGAAAFLMFFYGGYLYVASFGNEEMTGKAKKIITGAIIGIAIALAAFGIVRTLTSFTSGREVNLPGVTKEAGK